MNKKIIAILIALSLLTCIFSFNPSKVTADSGFDTSYDSGGGWSSSDSGWSSSDSGWSSSDSGWSSSGSYGGGSGEPLTFGDVIVMIIAIGVIILVAIASQKSKNKMVEKEKLNSLKIKKNEVDENIIKKYIPDFNRQEFLRERYNDYLKVQDDWMNFNYDSLKENLTDELYNQYAMQLDTLKVKNQQNIMRDFHPVKSDITNIREENGTLIVDVEMVVSFIDYIEQNGSLVRGSKTRKVYQHYSMTFIMKPETVDKCPNCGAELDNNSAQICSYCRSKITRLGSKWVLSKKESIKQK